MRELDIAAMRAEYGGEPDMSESWLTDGWEPLLRRWLAEAATSGIAEPNAMVLATVDRTDDGPRPVSRTVLCKDLSSAGVIFYTHYDSAKGRQLADIPYASATFVWPALAHQVHLRGPVHAADDDVTAAYWRSRPRNSRLGAWASEQSRPIGSRAELDRLLSEAAARFEDVDDIPVPPRWGGYLLRPEMVEFWQGRRSRLHNRIRMRLDDSGATVAVERLQP
ncbi:pyridoxamine 5'-phosphate oxidase [Nocardia sp. alder85J]|uniref:pyridoxamine 5'-phosphate oxidase n=1 Tax=Nocardia sp. alder85J TaxID=2862949 RepID=UPI001CD5ED6C|nr:pyridoxamine 5'-phosphate oxidase [Nocardia sp. alder85J]MCX4093305.1 pyridoxamine 5'-phosphate oxidase [Nocardia sp. alder85J]